MISKKEIVKYKNGVRVNIEDDLVNELKFTIAYKFRELSTILCSPENIEDLTAGYLYTSGLLKKAKLMHMNFNEEKKVMLFELDDDSVIKDMIISKLEPVGCGAGRQVFFENGSNRNVCPQIKISAENVSNLMNDFNNRSVIFKTTGGVHSSAIADTGSILVFREDIGRHNAVDKVIGNMYLSNIPLDDKILLTSGRISSEIVMKLANCNIQIIISRSAPTLRAVELAVENGMTLIGFARGGNFNIYCNPQRVVFEKKLTD